MESAKKASFVRKMGKKRLKLAKGGHVRREHFDGGGIAGLLGAAGGVGGTGYNTPSGTDKEQIDTAYNRNQSALDLQGNVASTLTPQIASAVNNQNTIANQYAQQASGQGPNVAMNVLNQATAGNVANQAAMAAGQRGAAGNVGLMARQSAQAGAGAQQTAAGQAATTQAQQQIAAQGAGAQLAANQITQGQASTTANTQANQGEQGILQGANTANNNVMGQFANTAMQGQQGMLGGIGNAVGAISGLFAEGGAVDPNHPAHPSHGHKKLEFIHKMAKMGMEHFDSGGIAVPNVQINSPEGQSFAQAPQVEGGFNPGENKGAAALGATGKHEHKKSAPAPTGITSAPTSANITGSNNPMAMNGQAAPMAPMAGEAMPFGTPMAAHGGMMRNHVANFLAEGGKVPAMVSPGEIYLSPDKVEAVVKGGADPSAVGEKIPGKAKVKGDSYRNDFVKKDLDAGGVVIDRENVGNKKKETKFVQRAIAKKKAGRK